LLRTLEEEEPVAGKKGMKRLAKRYSPRNPKSVNYYEKVRKRSVPRTPTFQKACATWSKLFRDITKLLSE
jgi:hypothetical protein